MGRREAGAEMQVTAVLQYNATVDPEPDKVKDGHTSTGAVQSRRRIALTLKVACKPR